METIIPKTSTSLLALFKADITTQWRNRRSVVLMLLVPVLITISWQSAIRLTGGPFVLSNGIGLGLIAMGLMGYSNSIARDREKGIFQRLRVAPVPSWAIMSSRLLVQLIMMVLITTVVFIVGQTCDGITLIPIGYILTYFTAFISGAVYLSLGQVIVGLIKNSETVNSTSRLVYFVFVMTSMVAVIGATSHDKGLGTMIANAVKWTPYGTVTTMLSASMQPEKWTMDTTWALLITIGYIIVFAGIGIQKFKWESK